MTNKTVSELPNFTGDTSMRLHVHKPGSSESISVDELTSGGLQTGDVVLRVAESNSDYLKCDGGYYETAAHPDLASKLNTGDFGSILTGLNLNSETRFGSERIVSVKRLGNLVCGLSESGTAIVLLDGVETFIQFMPTKIFKGAYGIYGTENGYMTFKIDGMGNPDLHINGDLVGVAKSEYYDGDLLFVREMAQVNVFVVYRDMQVSQIGTIQADEASDFNVISGGGYIYAKMKNPDGDGLFQVAAYPDNFNIFFLRNLEPSSKIYAGESRFYLFEYGTLKSARWGNYFDSDFSVMETPATTVEDIVYFANFLGIKQGGDTPFLMSFDSGATWVESPVMTSYLAIDVDKNGVVFGGDYGNTGSINNSSGSLQVNSFIYTSNVFFRTPNFIAPHNHFVHYIKR